MVKEIPLKIGSFYYHIEENIHPKGVIRHWLMQLAELPSDREQKKGKSIIFIVLVTNNRDFCNPGLNIAEIRCTNMFGLFKASTCMSFEEVQPEDFHRFMDFPLIKKNYPMGKGRIYYHEKFAEYAPLHTLPLLIGINKKMDNVIARRYADK